LCLANTSTVHSAAKFDQANITMRGLIYFLLALSIAHLDQARAIEHISLASPRDATAGGVRICYISPAIYNSSPEYSLCHDIFANEATECISQRDLKVRIVGGGGNHNSFLGSISPYEGGHCLVYATANCADNTAMPLINPNHLDLKFPRLVQMSIQILDTINLTSYSSKIIYPGIGKAMIPGGLLGIKCYPHPAS
jgi:hypothetical protein